jgi:hypothetical protein
MIAQPGVDFVDVGDDRVTQKQPLVSGSLPYTNVKITGYTAGKLMYSNSSGQHDRTVADNVHINITDEPAMNSAEDTWAANIEAIAKARGAKLDLTAKWSDAADNYLKAMKATNKPWLKDYMAGRLQKSAESANRFDIAVEAWLSAVQKDPAEALKHKPAVPDAGSTYLAGAVTAVESAEKNAGKGAVQQTLWSYELDLYRVQKNDAGVERVATAMASQSGDASNPQLVRAQAEGKLALARTAIDKKDFAGALKMLDAGKALFVAPEHQADAAFLAAEAHDGQAVAAPPANPDAWKDIALEYMKVVSDFPGNAHTADALLKAAQLHEKFDMPAALQTYQSIIRDYPPDKPAAAEARKSLERLKSAPQAGAR